MTCITFMTWQAVDEGQSVQLWRRINSGDTLRGEASSGTAGEEHGR
jgi:hypothetical protein